MIPILFELGPIKIHSYGLMLALGLIFGHYLEGLELTRRGYSERLSQIQLFVAAVGGISGARLFDILEHPAGFWTDPLGTLFAGGGLTWYGGFIVGVAIMFAVSRRMNIPFSTVLDSSAPGLAIGYGLGRAGCFLSGDGCYGVVCGAGLPAPLCMAFPNGLVPTHEVVYNTPLYEFAGAAAVFAYLWFVRAKVVRPGELFSRFLIIQGILRFAVEFIRHNPTLLWSFSQAQVISLLAIAGGLIWLAVLTIRGAAAAKPNGPAS